MIANDKHLHHHRDRPVYKSVRPAHIATPPFIKAGPQGLIDASWKGSLEMAMALLAAGADKEARDQVGTGGHNVGQQPR